MSKIAKMLSRLRVICLGALLLSAANAEEEAPFNIAQYEALEGFVDIYWDSDEGRVLVKVDEFDAPFLYQTSLSRGIGSNDIGLDRGQLGATRVVRFIRSGPKVLLLEDNLQYRANSDNEDERRAIAESFARSVIWGF
ncbi:MAG: peptidase, partial [Gammaproteobacteria bacterium]|nr:peptidase [Gammaproteobacteria bacterium]